MTATRFITISLTPSAAVDTDDTMVFTYPSGYTAAAQFLQSGERLIVSGLQNDLDQDAATFTTSYDGSACTVTYKDATSIPAGTEVTVQLPLSVYGALTDLTDSSGGTASGTLADVTEANNTGSADRVPTENAIASLAAKVAALNAIVNQLVTDIVPTLDRN